MIHGFSENINSIPEKPSEFLTLVSEKSNDFLAIIPEISNEFLLVFPENYFFIVFGTKQRIYKPTILSLTTLPLTHKILGVGCKTHHQNFYTTKGNKR